MYMCMCVCVYICIYKYVCVCVYAHIYGETAPGLHGGGGQAEMNRKPAEKSSLSAGRA